MMTCFVDDNIAVDISPIMADKVALLFVVLNVSVALQEPIIYTVFNCIYAVTIITSCIILDFFRVISS